MAKKILFWGLIGLVIAVGFSTSSCGSKEKTASSTVLDHSLFPGALDFLLKIGSVETIYDHFSVTGNSIFGYPVEGIEEIRSRLGFNPLIPDELRAHGFDTRRELVFGLDKIRFKENVEEPAFTALFLLPVTDAGKAMKALRFYLENAYPDVLFHERESWTYFEVPASLLRGGMVERENYLLITAGSEVEIEPYVDSLLAGKRDEADTAAFRNVMNGVDSESEILSYIGIRSMMERNSEALRRMSENASDEAGRDLWRNLKFLKDYRGAGFSLDPNRSDLLLNGILDIMPGSDALKVMSAIRYNKRTLLRVSEPPAVLFSTAVDVPEYYRVLRETMTPEERQAWEGRMARLRENPGIDFEKDVIANIDGNLNVGIFDGASINLTNYNALVTLSIKNEAEMKRVLGQAVSSLTPDQRATVTTVKVGDTDAYVTTLFGVFQLYLGVKDQNLILSVGKPLFEKAVTGDPETGFTSRITDPGLSRALKGDTGILYLDFFEIKQAMNNFLFLVRQFNLDESIRPDSNSALNRFEYLLLSGRLEGNSLHTGLEIRTRFEKPFFKGLYETFEEVKASSAKNATTAP